MESGGGDEIEGTGRVQSILRSNPYIQVGDPSEVRRMADGKIFVEATDHATNEKIFFRLEGTDHRPGDRVVYDNHSYRLGMVFVVSESPIAECFYLWHGTFSRRGR